MIEIPKKPFVSVCIPTYNRANFLQDSIVSIINQTYQNIEIIILDNASTDSTEYIVKKLKSFSNIKYIRNKKNIGATNNYNKCLEIAKNDYIAIFHSDDVYKKDILEKEMDVILKYPNIGAVFTNCFIINEKNNLIGSNIFPKKLKGKIIFNFYEIFEELLKNGNSFVMFPTLLIKKDILKEVGSFKTVFRTASDMEFWLRLLTKYNIAILEEKLIKRRVSPYSGSSAHYFLKTKRSDFFLVINYYLRNHSSDFNKKTLRQYKFQKSYDNLKRSFNLLLLNNLSKSKRILLKSVGKDTFFALFSNYGFKKILKYLLMISFISIYKLKLENIFRKIIMIAKFKTIKNN